MPLPYVHRPCAYPMFAGHDPTLYSQAMRAQPLERPTAEQMQRHAWLLTTPAVRAPSPLARSASAEASDEEEESAEEEEASEEEQESAEASEEEGAEEASSAEAAEEDQAEELSRASELHCRWIPLASCWSERSAFSIWMLVEPPTN